jgi:hypothetical protein
VEIQTLLVSYARQYSVLADQMDPARVAIQTATSPQQLASLAQETQSHLCDNQKVLAYCVLQFVLLVKQMALIASLVQQMPSIIVLPIELA